MRFGNVMGSAGSVIPLFTRHIEIKYVGLRPGEKLYEELITVGEGIVPTPHEKIMVLRSVNGVDKAAVLARARWIEELAAACVPEDELMSAVQGLVPEYQEPRTGDQGGLSPRVPLQCYT